MQTRLIKIGNSLGLRLPKSLIQQYKLEGEIKLEPVPDGILITSANKAREGWKSQLAQAIENGQVPDDELLEGFSDSFEDQEWK